MQGVAVKAENLSVGYGKKIVLDGINIEILPGEVISVIGPNGAGKSTFLRTLSKELKPLYGNVTIAGEDILKMSGKDSARYISALMTGRNGGELMTVREVVSLGRYPYTDILGRLKENDISAVSDIAEKFRITDIMDEYFDELSDGQRQRVLLAKSVCQDADVLLLDEPTSYLDIKYKLELLSLLSLVAREKKMSIIMILHDLSLVRKYSDRIISVKNGKIDRFGKVEEVFTKEYISGLFDISLADFSDLYGIFTR